MIKYYFYSKKVLVSILISLDQFRFFYLVFFDRMLVNILFLDLVSLLLALLVWQFGRIRILKNFELFQERKNSTELTYLNIKTNSKMLSIQGQFYFVELLFFINK